MSDHETRARRAEKLKRKRLQKQQIFEKTVKVDDPYKRIRIDPRTVKEDEDDEGL